MEEQKRISQVSEESKRVIEQSQKSLRQIGNAENNNSEERKVVPEKSDRPLSNVSSLSLDKSIQQ